MENSEHYILFTLAGTTYAVRSGEVQQMDMVEQITPVPNAPPSVEGVVFLRGQVIPAINLRVRFGFPKAPYDLQTRLIVVRRESRVVGLIVDTARDFVMIPAATIQPPPEGIAALSGRYLAGIATVGERLVLILDIAEVINPADIMTTAPESAQIQEEREDEKRR
ncbi:MAG TPA: chemotaxis protein CheW [Syntrophales bacterium]|jgi:purine-binding chemotaxis protein CheW|nr:chemotaxis protein CheW [Syntrophales bacterium]HQI36415.1 chemotaxis protein CheW [Syntrophales bacterium]HQJ30691.1 chemotaxis protein CheW [Syntrophales bacterium]